MSSYRSEFLLQKLTVYRGGAFNDKDFHELLIKVHQSALSDEMKDNMYTVLIFLQQCAFEIRLDGSGTREYNMQKLYDFLKIMTYLSMQTLNRLREEYTRAGKKFKDFHAQVVEEYNKLGKGMAVVVSTKKSSATEPTMKLKFKSVGKDNTKVLVSLPGDKPTVSASVITKRPHSSYPPPRAPIRRSSPLPLIPLAGLSFDNGERASIGQAGGRGDAGIERGGAGGGRGGAGIERGGAGRRAGPATGLEHDPEENIHLLNILSSLPNYSFEDPSNYTRLLRFRSEYTSDSRQHDAHEFLTWFSNNYSNLMNTKYTQSTINRCFRRDNSDVYATHPTLQYSPRNEEDFIVLVKYLNMNTGHPLPSAFFDFDPVRLEKLLGCNANDSSVNADEQSIQMNNHVHSDHIPLQFVSYKNFSDYILVRLGRERNDRTKIMPRDLQNMNIELSFEKEGNKYELCGIIFHIGSTLDSGHYVSRVKTQKGWYTLNDSVVRTLGPSEDCLRLEDEVPYILLYTSVPLKTYQPTGIYNIINSCYMNSSLQLIRYIVSE